MLLIPGVENKDWDILPLAPPVEIRVMNGSCFEVGCLVLVVVVLELELVVVLAAAAVLVVVAVSFAVLGSIDLTLTDKRLFNVLRSRKDEAVGVGTDRDDMFIVVFVFVVGMGLKNDVVFVWRFDISNRNINSSTRCICIYTSSYG